MTVRKALVSDAEVYGRVVVTAWRAAYKGIVPDEYLAAMDPANRAKRLVQTLNETEVLPESPSYVAEINGEIIGILHFDKYSEDTSGDTGEVGAIYLLPEFWGKGYGRQMMDFAIEDFRRRGYKAAVVWVFEENAQARTFYEKAGFRLTGQTKIQNRSKDLVVVEMKLELEGVS